MKQVLTICTVFLLGCSMGAFAQDTQDKQDKMSKASQDKMSKTSLSPADTKFVKQAAGGGLAEVKLGQLAQEKGSSDFVKQFGKKMVDDHSKINDDLKAVAEKNNVTLPSDLPPKEQAVYDRLSKLSGDAFDKAYLAEMQKDHRKDIADFKKEASSGSNADVKEFASKNLPTLEGHLQMLESKKVTS
jgi:putative membrane protein